MKHVIVIETAENDFVPSTNPTTDDLVRWLTEAIEVRQGERRPAAASHVWWMRNAKVTQLGLTPTRMLSEVLDATQDAA